MTPPSVELGTVASVERKSVKPDEIGSHQSYVGLENITADGTFVEVAPAGEADIRSNKFAFSSDHILYGKLRPYLSKIAAPQFAGVCSTDIVPIRPGPDIDRRFLLHVLRAPAMVGHATRLAVGANLPRLSPKSLETFPIPLPPIEEQRRIAAVLDAADALRAKRREALAKLDTLTQSIFINMFGDPANNQRAWDEVPVAELADGRDGIKCGPFGTQLSAKEYAGEGVPLWGIPQVNRHFRVPTDEFLSPVKAQALASYDIRPGDIVMTRKGTVGNCAVYPDDFPPGIMHSDLLRLRLGEDADPTFLAAQLTHSRSVQHQVRSMSGGAVMAGINVTKLRDLVVLAPPAAMQREFARRVSVARQQRLRLEGAGARLNDLFASLQQRAFRGEL